MVTPTDRLVSALADTIEWIKSTAPTVEGFAKEQVPLVIQEYLAWEVAAAIFGIVAPLIIGAIMYFVGYHLGKYAEATPLEVNMYGRQDWPARKTVAFGFGVVLRIIPAFALIPIGINTYNLVKVKAAPRVVLIERLSSLVTGKN